MNLSLSFIRIFFTLISMAFATVYAAHAYPGPIGWIGGLLGGLAFGLLLTYLDNFFRRFNLRSFNIALIGIFFGYLMGQALVLVFHAILSLIFTATVHTHLSELIEIALFLFGIYLGLILTLRASSELFMSIPFVKFTSVKEKKRDLLLDYTALSDPRIVDLSHSGLLDFHLIIPRFVIRDLYSQTESGDENTKQKARKSLENLRELEEHPELGVRFNDTDFPEIKDLTTKLTRLARLLNANILTSDITKTQAGSVEGVRTINLHSLASAFKPLTESGEIMTIKIQRHGKEANQGVGYLEDGTMVVVNGGGDHIGETLEVNVLSVKQTSSGRMIFCNLTKDEQEN